MDEFCSSCGAQREGTDTYCRKCGTAWNAPATAGETASVAKPEKRGGFLGKAFFGGFVGCFGVLAAGIVILIVVGIIVAASQDDDADVVSGQPGNGSEQGDPGGEQVDPLNLAIGQTAKVGDAEVTVHSFRTSRGDETFGPDTGNIYVIVDATVRNAGDDPYNISSLLQTGLRDSEGREHSLTIPIGADAQGQLDGTIPPGDVLRGETAFEVPETATGLQFVFSQALGTQQARWNLQ